MSLQNYSRAERKWQVKQAIAISNQRGMGSELTAYRIARALGMKPSMHVTRILAEMVASGDLKCRKVVGRPGRWDTFVYSWPEYEVFNSAPKKREIAIKANGKQVGQLELF